MTIWEDTERSIKSDLYEGHITQLHAVKQVRESRQCSFKEAFDEVLKWIEERKL